MALGTPFSVAGAAGPGAFASLTRALADVGRAVNSVLLPPLKELAKVATDIGQTVLKGLVESLRSVASTVRTVALPPLQLLGERLRFVGDVVRFTAVGAVEKLGEVLKPLGERFLFVADVVRFTALGAIQKLGEVLKPLGERFLFAKDLLVAFGQTFADRFGGPLAAAGGVLGRVGGLAGKVAGYLSGVAGAVGRAVGSVGSALGSMAKFAAGTVDAVLAVGQAMVSFVAKANPVVAEQFLLALNDLMAVMGQALVPVFKLLTEAVRAVADTYATFLADLGSTAAAVLRPALDVFKAVMDVVGRVGQVAARAFDAAAPALVAIGSAIVSLAEAASPLANLLTGALGAALNGLAEIVKAVAPYVVALTRVVGDMLQAAVRWIRDALAFVGLDIPEGGPGRKEGASVGAAVRSASTTDVDSVLRKARESAFSLGAASREDPAKMMVDLTKGISAKADHIYEGVIATRDEVVRVVNGILELPGEIAAAIRGGLDTVADAGRSILSDPIGAAGDAIDFTKRKLGDLADSIGGLFRRGGSGTVD